jgi:cytochrome c5
LRQPDQQFFDSFMLVVGILIGVTVGLFFLVRMIAIDTQGQYVLDDPSVQEQIDERIEPVGRVVLAGSAELAAAQAAPVVAAQPVATTLTGAQVFNQACFACHAAPGVGGAPVVGDAAAWQDRVAQGMDTLTDHAVNGYQGESGFMPAKGGRVDLSDEEVVAGVEYMLEQLEQP